MTVDNSSAPVHLTYQPSTLLAQPELSRLRHGGQSMFYHSPAMGRFGPSGLQGGSYGDGSTPLSNFYYPSSSQYHSSNYNVQPASLYFSNHGMLPNMGYGRDGILAPPMNVTMNSPFTEAASGPMNAVMGTRFSGVPAHHQGINMWLPQSNDLTMNRSMAVPHHVHNLNQLTRVPLQHYRVPLQEHRVAHQNNRILLQDHRIGHQDNRVTHQDNRVPPQVNQFITTEPVNLSTPKRDWNALILKRKPTSKLAPYVGPENWIPYDLELTTVEILM
jgi:hypothetical protein